MKQRPIEERLAYLGLDDEAFELLSELRPLLEEHADELAEQFYRHMLAFEETRVYFRDEETKERFLYGRSRYIVSLADSHFGPEYFEERRRSGQMQEAIGLSPAWISRLSALHVSLLAPVLTAHFEGDLTKAARTVQALMGRFALDVEIALESFMERREQGLAFMAEELARERRRLQEDLREQGATLRETTERAKVAEELASIATLVAGLAHEIGTPMGVIQGHAKMLEKHVEGGDGVWRLQTIQDQIARISRIIQMLLKIAHPHRWNPEVLDLAALLEQSLSFVSEKLSARGIELKQSLAPRTTVLGDRERLQQLFLNLLLNAADAMPDGGELRVEVSASEGRVRVRLVDTGIGIGADDLPRIFEPFFTTKEAGQGNGLGLMVCKGIVADHGGEVEVASEPGRGTTFTISLPPTEPDSAPRRPTA
jgi:signal transduction histidine kinase